MQEGSLTVLFIVACHLIACLSSQSEDFVLLVLLCSWLSVAASDSSEEFQVLDFFSGKGRITELASKAGLRAAALDLSMESRSEPPRYRKKAGRSFRSPMDWNGESGFAFFVPKHARASVSRVGLFACLWILP